MKPSVKFLTVVWGPRYIERFCTLSLPSFLAQGNLPALAQATDLEVVLMTCRKDFSEFERFPAFRRLQAIAPVRFIEIDDLVQGTSVYGVTLTLAYARPIIACGEAMLKTHFVFMNADFVLADGSLRHLIPAITNNQPIVLAPSFRAIAEKVEPALRSRVHRLLGLLEVPPRQMVGLALPHLHRTTLAKIRNQSLLHSTHPNQFFWRVDQDTLIARYFLIFMLALKPERIITHVNSYCDYGLIPELCPSGREIVMGDSDEFFMLELQERDTETHMLRFGEQSLDRIAQSLGEWTTAEHRRAARHPIVFHASDLPSLLPEAHKEADRFIDWLQKHMPPPKSHIGHFYWVMGVHAWLEQRSAHHISEFPPELHPVKGNWLIQCHLCKKQVSFHLRYAAAFPDFAFLKNAIDQFWDQSHELRIIDQTHPLLEKILEDLVQTHINRFVTRPDKLGDSLQSSNNPTLEPIPCILFLTQIDSKEFCKTVLSAVRHSAPGTRILIIFHPTKPTHVPDNLIETFEEICGLLESASIVSIGGPLFWKVRRLGLTLRYCVDGSKRAVRIARIFLLPLFLLLNAYLSLLTRQGKPYLGIRHRFTSLAITLKLYR